MGRVIAGWRGDGITTTTPDIVKKFIEIKGEYNLCPIAQVYDWSDADFLPIATGMVRVASEDGDLARRELFHAKFLFEPPFLSIQRTGANAGFNFKI